MKSLWGPVLQEVVHLDDKYLCPGGMITVINACMSTFPMYHMLLFKMPKAVALGLITSRGISFWRDWR